jgi:stress-induced morphogen
LTPGLGSAELLAMLDPSALTARLRDALPDAEIQLKDLTGSMDHYELVLVSSGFERLNAVARHRLVYGVLADHMRGDIHALSLRTYTPDEWAQHRKN